MGSHGERPAQFFLITKTAESLCRVLYILHCQPVRSRGQSHETGRAGMITKEMESLHVKWCQKTEEEPEVRGLNSYSAQLCSSNKVKLIKPLAHAWHTAGLHTPWHLLPQVGSLGLWAAALLCLHYLHLSCICSPSSPRCCNQIHRFLSSWPFSPSSHCSLMLAGCPSTFSASSNLLLL